MLQALHGPEHHPQSDQLRIMTYNLLADKLVCSALALAILRRLVVLTANMCGIGQALEHARELYHAIHPSLLSWEYRLPSILRELEAHRADIMCLQEVDHPKDLQPALSLLGYDPTA